MAIRVAYALGLPVVNGIKAITVRDDGRACAASVRSAPAGIVYELTMPAVVTVMEGINLPRYPVGSRPDARQAQAGGGVCSRRPDDAKLKLVRLALPAASGKQVEILGSGVDAAPKVVEILQEIGVLG